MAEEELTRAVIGAESPWSTVTEAGDSSQEEIEVAMSDVAEQSAATFSIFQ
jgi:hypothetical protein